MRPLTATGSDPVGADQISASAPLHTSLPSLVLVLLLGGCVGDARLLDLLEVPAVPAHNIVHTVRVNAHIEQNVGSSSKRSPARLRTRTVLTRSMLAQRKASAGAP